MLNTEPRGAVSNQACLKSSGHRSRTMHFLQLIVCYSWDGHYLSLDVVLAALGLPGLPATPGVRACLPPRRPRTVIRKRAAMETELGGWRTRSSGRAVAPCRCRTRKTHGD